MVRCHMIEIRQNESVGEEDCVIKERLSDHQSEPQQGSPSESDEKRLKDLPQRRVRARPQEHGLECRSVFKVRAVQAESGFYFIDYFFGFRLPSVNDEPARAFRDPRPQKKNDKGGARTRGKTQAASRRRDRSGWDREQRANRPRPARRRSKTSR